MQFLVPSFVYFFITSRDLSKLKTIFLVFPEEEATTSSYLDQIKKDCSPIISHLTHNHDSIFESSSKAPATIEYLSGNVFSVNIVIPALYHNPHPALAIPVPLK